MSSKGIASIIDQCLLHIVVTQKYWIVRFEYFLIVVAYFRNIVLDEENVAFHKIAVCSILLSSNRSMV